MKYMIFPLLFASLLMGFSSCNKEEDSNAAANEKFIGTYYGTLTCLSANAQTVVITAGTDEDNIVIEFVGDITVNGKVSGAAITIPAQQGLHGNGSLSGNDLTLTTTASTTCTYHGTK